VTPSVATPTDADPDASLGTNVCIPAMVTGSPVSGKGRKDPGMRPWTDADRPGTGRELMYPGRPLPSGRLQAVQG